MSGRPSKLTQEVHDKIVQMVRVGVHFETACRAAGVAESTAYEWRRRGDDNDKRVAKEPYVSFAAALGEAEATAEAGAVAAVRRSAARNWQAAAWWLERTHPERWSAPAKKSKGAGGRPVGTESAPDRQRPGEPPRLTVVKRDKGGS